MYKSRWQAEFLFKHFKQNFSVTTLKPGSTSYAETEVRLWLIIWASCYTHINKLTKGDLKYDRMDTAI